MVPKGCVNPIKSKRIIDIVLFDNFSMWDYFLSSQFVTISDHRRKTERQYFGG